VLTASGVSKTFFGNTVLSAFSIELADGTVHALLGHNGSGKSTFVKLLAGFHSPDRDSGRIAVDGEPLKPGNPDSSRAVGIRFVHQDLGLLNELTVLENLRLGLQSYRTNALHKIDWRGERRRAREQLDRLGLRIDPERRFGDLSAVEQTEVAVARAIQDEDRVRVLVLDEPTAALPDAEVEKLFTVLRHVRGRGVAVLYVTHRLEEVHAIADHVTVLRDGKTVGSATTKEISRNDLVELIVGGQHARAAIPAPRAAAAGAPALELSGVSAGDIEELTLSVSPGEIVGVAGLVGSGVHDVPRVLNGQLTPRAGHVAVQQRPIKLRSPHHARVRGLVVLPSRRGDKLIQDMTVKENLTLTSLARFFRGGLLRHATERSYVRAQVTRYGIRAASIESPMRTLSGGNQQKVAVARSLQSGPSVLVLDEPTQGVDVGGKSDVLRLLRQAADDGVAVLVCSSDLEELEQVCQRIVVMRRGRAVAELAGSAITRQTILRECYGDDD
jgi:ribose transport system ATP-binding protein